MVKNPPANAGDAGDAGLLPRSLETPGDPLEKEMATHSSLLAWEIPWIEEPPTVHGVTKMLDTTY